MLCWKCLSETSGRAPRSAPHRVSASVLQASTSTALSPFEARSLASQIGDFHALACSREVHVGLRRIETRSKQTGTRGRFAMAARSTRVARASQDRQNVCTSCFPSTTDGIRVSRMTKVATGPRVTASSRSFVLSQLSLADILH